MSDQYATSKNLDARAAIHHRFTPEGKDLWDLVWHHYNFKTGQSVLDVGCGTGVFWTHPAAKPCDIDTTLVDASPGMIEAVKKNLAGTAWNPKFEVADAQNLPFADRSFDVVLAHFMLYHVSDKARALDEFKRIARDWVGIVLVGAENMHRIYDAMTATDASVTVPPSDGDKFNSDVGVVLINKHFSSVDPHLYELEMRVTDTDMVVAYAQSTQASQGLPDSFWSAYRDNIQNEVNQIGYFSVTKSAALFLCRN